MSYLYQPVSAVTGPLELRGQREGADSGGPQISWTGFDAPDHVRVGVWEAEPGGWPIVNRPDTETCYIVSGRAAITDGATGENQEITAGDVIVFPEGWSGRWDVIETIRKVYSIVVPAIDGCAGHQVWFIRQRAGQRLPLLRPQPRMPRPPD